MSCVPLAKFHKFRGKHAFKVRGCKSSVKYGVAAKSLSGLLKVACHKLQLQQSRVSRVVLEEDGTEVEEDDVLLLLPHNTSMVFLLDGQYWQPSERVSSAQQLQQTLQGLVASTQHKRRVVEELQETMTSQTSRPLQDMLAKLSAAASLNPQPSDRSQHPHWFTGVEAKFKTKEAFMRERARARVRGYLTTARDFVKDCGQVRHLITPVIKRFDRRLKEEEFYASYFDRSASTDPMCMCDSAGWFGCEGAYDVRRCVEVHQINPYGSLTERITFSTWNLDHRIEKSREVLPQLIKALEKKPARKTLNWEYFYELLFTRTNLKLVHIACHDKKEHSTAKCDPKLFYK